jgi:hypothetical protein
MLTKKTPFRRTAAIRDDRARQPERAPGDGNTFSQRAHSHRHRFPAAFTGAWVQLLIETLFSLDGLGLLSFEMRIRRDYLRSWHPVPVLTLIAGDR